MRYLLTVSSLFLFLTSLGFAQAKSFTDDFAIDDCKFDTEGRNRYFILEPGYQLTLENGKGSKLVITVLNETKRIGNVETRIIEENESENGRIVEISRNYFAVCNRNNSIFYFGEDVDIFKNNKIISNEGAWTAVGNNKAGVAMPGIILIGSRYHQEIAPGIAMDRAEIVSISETRATPAGIFTNCLKTEETNALKPKEKEIKFYAPGIGLIQDEDLLLTKYGFIN